jgi:MFS transporter, PPP family, 3-phenylpropionic acid transporter
VAEKVEVRATSLPRAWRLGFLYAAVFLVGGCYLPYLPVWLHWRELTADQIAVLLATPPFARIVLRRLSASPPTGQEAAGRS